MSTEHYFLINVYSINDIFILNNCKEALDTGPQAEMVTRKAVSTNATHILPHTGMIGSPHTT